MTRKKDYKTPLIERNAVLLEDGICATSGEPIVTDTNTEVTIERQEGFDEEDITINSWES